MSPTLQTIQCHYFNLGKLLFLDGSYSIRQEATRVEPEHPNLLNYTTFCLDIFYFFSFPLLL